MADKETKNEKRLREEKELESLSQFGIDERYGDVDLRRASIKQLADRVKDKITNKDDGYGTSRSAGARAAGKAMSDKLFNEEGKTILESMTDPRVRQSMREAAAQERREARGYKKGGKVNSASKRADGCCVRGKTRGKMV